MADKFPHWNRNRGLRGGDVTFLQKTPIASMLRKEYLPAQPIKRLKTWNGSAWVVKPMKQWDGAEWVEHQPRVWTGNSWFPSADTDINTAFDVFLNANPTYWAGKNILMVGDSGFDDVGAVDGYMADRIRAFALPGQPLAGATVIDDSWTGSTLRDWLDDLIAYGITHTIAANPTLVILSYGTNDMRLGKSRSQLSADLREAVTRLLAALPNVRILLDTPPTFLSSDPTGSNYLLPIGAAQTRSDNMWGAYDDVRNEWPTRVAHSDSMEITGRTALPSHPLYQDTLHLNSTGAQARAVKYVARITSKNYPFVAADPFLTDTVLVVNPDSVSDARGRHTVTANGSVTVGVDGIVFGNTASGLQFSGNLPDFNWGSGSGAIVTVDMEFTVPVGTTRANGVRLLNKESGFEIGLTADPDMKLQTFPPFLQVGGPLDTGTRQRVSFQHGPGDQYTVWINGAVVPGGNGYESIDFTNAVPLWFGRQPDGWDAVGFEGTLHGLRVTHAGRYVHNAPITPPTFPVPA